MNEDDLRDFANRLIQDHFHSWQKRVRNVSGDYVFLRTLPGVVIPLRYIAHVDAGNHPDAARTIPQAKDIDRLTRSLENSRYHSVKEGQSGFEEAFKDYLVYYKEISELAHKKANCEGRKGQQNQYTFWIPSTSDEITSPNIAPEDLTLDHIVDAMERFKNGEEPRNFGKPRNWYVEHPKTKELFPLKGIYGLATGRSCSIKTPGGFRTSNATREFRRLGLTCVQEKSDTIAVDLQRGIEKSRKDTSEARRKRIAAAPKKPSKYTQMVTRFHRNPDVITERLDMAQGICEKCHQPAPFRKKKNGDPFLEVHHVIPLADNGEDTVENTRALCPNCHRKAHDRMTG